VSRSKPRYPFRLAGRDRRQPNPNQLQPNERVERTRRIQLNDLANLPFFLTASFLFVLTDPSLLLARWLIYGYVVSRLCILLRISRRIPMIHAPPYGPWARSFSSS
jgi:hypothetical protein